MAERHSTPKDFIGMAAHPTSSIAHFLFLAAFIRESKSYSSYLCPKKHISVRTINHIASLLLQTLQKDKPRPSTTKCSFSKTLSFSRVRPFIKRTSLLESERKLYKIEVNLPNGHYFDRQLVHIKEEQDCQQKFSLFLIVIMH